MGLTAQANHIHTSGLAVCHSNSAHRYNRESINSFISKYNTLELQQRFLDSTHYQSIADHSESKDIPTSQITLAECDFIFQLSPNLRTRYTY